MDNIIITPKCECHDVDMYWAKEKRLKNGGRWRCRIKAREANKRFRESGQAKIHDRKYRQSEHGRKKMKEYRKIKWASLSPEEKTMQMQKFKNRIEELEKDVLWRLKQDTLRWQRNRKRGKYI